MCFSAHLKSTCMAYENIIKSIAFFQHRENSKFQQPEMQIRDKDLKQSFHSV